MAEQLSKQVALLYTNSRYLHPYLTGYSKRLLQTFPKPLSVMFWVNSGSEANDLALRLAREHTKRRGIITVEGAYHGHLTSIIDISPYKYNRTGGQGKRGFIREAAAPDVYSGKYRGSIDDTNITNAYVNDIKILLQELQRDEEIETSIRIQQHLFSAGNKSNNNAGYNPTKEDDHQSILSTINNTSTIVGEVTNPLSLSSANTVTSDTTNNQSMNADNDSPSSSASNSFYYDTVSSASSVYPRSISTSLGSHHEVFATVSVGTNTSSSSSASPSEPSESSPNPAQPTISSLLPSKFASSLMTIPSTVVPSYTAEQQEYIRTHLSDDGLQAGCGAFIMESILSCGGQIMPPKNYFRQVYQAVREAGGVCIADEVQTGFGRVGSHFWAFQLQGEDIVPDIVTIGKPMGNGFPVAAVVTTPEIARSFASTGIEYFNTFGGNPLACTAALATLDIIENEQLQANALKVGEVLVEGFTRLMKKYNDLTKDNAHKPFCIGSVRGTGLMVGMEFITDPISRQADGTTAVYIKYEALKKYNILLSTDGMHDQVIKLKPPMCFTVDNALTVITAIDHILQSIITQGNICSV